MSDTLDQNPINNVDVDGQFFEVIRKAWNKVLEFNEWLGRRFKDARDIWRALPRLMRRCFAGALAFGATALFLTRSLQFTAGMAVVGCVFGTTRLYRKIG